MGDGIFNGNTATNISSGDPDKLESIVRYTVIRSILVANYKTTVGGLSTGVCTEGGQNLSTISDTDYSLYPSLDLKGASTFTARVAGAGPGGTISICLDEPTSAPVGTCPVPSIGGDQSWTMVSCPLNGVSEGHDVYLVYHGTGKNLFNLEWFAFSPVQP